MITMTCNPEWPEIVSQLRPGQTAADIPMVVARVFKARLDQLLQLLRTKFGDVIYSIRVIEFQKRGFPHAHIIIKVRLRDSTYQPLFLLTHAIALPVCPRYSSSRNGQAPIRSRTSR
jgi:hypothetical protein